MLKNYFGNAHNKWNARLQPGERANRRPLNTRLKPGVPFTGLFSSSSLNPVRVETKLQNQ